MGIQAYSFYNVDEKRVDEPKKVEYFKLGKISYEVDGLDEEAEIDEYMSEHGCTLSEATIHVLDRREKQEVEKLKKDERYYESNGTFYQIDN